MTRGIRPAHLFPVLESRGSVVPPQGYRSPPGRKREKQGRYIVSISQVYRKYIVDITSQHADNALARRVPLAWRWLCPGPESVSTRRAVAQRRRVCIPPRAFLAGFLVHARRAVLPDQASGRAWCPHRAATLCRCPKGAGFGAPQRRARRARPTSKPADDLGKTPEAGLSILHPPSSLAAA